MALALFNMGLRDRLNALPPSEAFDALKILCSPDPASNVSGVREAREMLAAAVHRGAKIRLRRPPTGKCGDRRRATHETMFSILYPHLREQVSFGTGAGGRLRYGAGRYTVDFFDGDNRIAIEIDGPSHRRPKVQVIDERRKRFFDEKGIQIVRLPNERVEALVMEYLCKQFANGDPYFTIASQRVSGGGQ